MSNIQAYRLRPCQKQRDKSVPEEQGYSEAAGVVGIVLSMEQAALVPFQMQSEVTKMSRTVGSAHTVVKAVGT